MSSISLMIDEENELTFQVQIEGTRPGKAKCRLMLESNDMNLAFEGVSSGDEVSVTLPPLDHVLKEGIYDMTLEVVVDDRFFEPLKIQGEFDKRLKVTAESVTIKSKPKVKTSASLVEVKKKEKKEKVKMTNNVQKERLVKEEKKNRTFTDKDILSLINKIKRGKR